MRHCHVDQLLSIPVAHCTTAPSMPIIVLPIRTPALLPVKSSYFNASDPAIQAGFVHLIQSIEHVPCFCMGPSILYPSTSGFCRVSYDCVALLPNLGLAWRSSRLTRPSRQYWQTFCLLTIGLCVPSGYLPMLHRAPGLLCLYFGCSDAIAPSSTILLLGCIDHLLRNV